MKNNEQNKEQQKQHMLNEKQKVAESDYDLKGTAAGKDQALKESVKNKIQTPHHSGTRGK